MDFYLRMVIVNGLGHWIAGRAHATLCGGPTTGPRSPEPSKHAAPCLRRSAWWRSSI